MFWRPKPMFGTGMLVLVLRPDLIAGEREHYYLLIRYRRWACPDGERECQWVYDGLRLDAHGDRIEVLSQVSCVLEPQMRKVNGL